MIPLTSGIGARLLVAGGLLIIGFGAGFITQGWRLNSIHAAEIKQCTDAQHKIELAIEKQNGGVTLANYKLEIAEEARKAAQVNADYFKNQYASQTAKAKQITATTCRAMIDDLKGVR